MAGHLTMNKKAWLYMGGAVLIGVAAYQTKKKVTEAVYSAGIEARTATENAILAADDVLQGIPSALGKWWMVDVLHVWEDDTQTGSYNWLEGNTGEWPGI